MANLVPVDHDPFAGDEAAMMPETYVNPMVKATLEHMATLPRRAIDAAAMYQPGSGEIPQETIGTALESAMLPMGTGAVAGLPVRAGETVLGAGPIRAYHGSPHDFDTFSLDKIGTGEGAQAYGHGLYFAENEGVAGAYKKNLAPASADIAPSWKGDGWQVTTRDGGNFDRQFFPTKQEAEEHVAKFNKGHMYEVNINADPSHFLNWDKSLSEQSPKVQEALAGRGLKFDRSGSQQFDNALLDALQSKGPSGALPKQPINPTGEDIYRHHAHRESFAIRPTPTEAFQPHWATKFEDALASAGNDPSRVRRIINPSATASSEVLREAGIPGIKYLDQGSRAGGEGTSNYVVFNDKLIDILRKYGIAGLPAAGAATSAIQAQPSPEDVVNAIRGQGGG